MRVVRYLGLLVPAALSVMAATADTPDMFGRATGLDAPSLSPSGQYLAVECAPEGAPAVCIFDLLGKSESRFIPISADYRLQGQYWPNNDYLIINVSQFESVQTGNGQKEYDFQRALSYELSSGEVSLLLRDEYGALDTQSVVSVLPDDDRNVLIMTVAANAARSSSSLGSVIPDQGGTSWTLTTFKTNLKTGKSRRRDSFPPAVMSVWFDVEGNEVARLVYPDKRTDQAELRSGDRVLKSFNTTGVAEFHVYGLDAATDKLVVFNDIGDKDGLYYMSRQTGELEPIILDGKEVGRASSIRDSYTRSIVGFHYFDGLPVQYFIDPQLKAAHEAMKTALPDKRVSLVSWNRDKTKIAVSAQSPGRPADHYVFDRTSGQLGSVGSSASHMVNQPTGTVTGLDITTRDGLDVEVIATLPPGKSMADGPFPTIIMPHGGPEQRDGLGYDWWTQAYAAEGYLVLQPNFRGSSGYGQAFRNAGFGEFGGKMIDDIVDTGAWAVEQGLAKDRQYCVIGASYGGYAALMMGLRDAGRTACVASVNGVSDPFRLIAQYEVDSETHEYWERYIGSNRYSSDVERNTVSPLQRAGEYDIPIMLIYGEEDLVVPADQSLQMARALDGRVVLETASLGAEDHNLRTSDARNTVLTRTLAFLDENHPAR
ncbi:prolyl oligopeptidase family serine peptidase [Henriciella sp.]|uniref:alpha/beta hydrolase family protein n=1 Tax=Henriciella sp. TaxID=1968823 RepID=UPI002604796A|nr:prolyl oligopeptidase family serine peptidase [Henriciella sp.]